MKQQQSIKPQELLKLAIHHWKVIVAIVSLCTGYAYYQTKDDAPSYRSEATVEIDQQVVLGLQVGEVDMRDTDILYTQVEKATSTAVLKKAITLSTYLQEYFEVDDVENEESLEDAADQLSTYSIRAKLRPDTLLIDLSVTTKEKDLTYEIAKAVSEGFTKSNKDENTIGYRTQIESLQKTKEETQKDYDRAYKEFLEFNSKASSTGIESRELELNTQIIKAEEERRTHERKLNKLKRDLGKIQDLGFSLAGPTEQNLILVSNKFEQFREIQSVYEDEEFVSRLALLKTKEDIVKDLSVNFLEKHPKMEEAARDVSNYKEAVIKTIAEIPNKLIRESNITEDSIKEIGEIATDYSEERTELLSMSSKLEELKSTMENESAYLDLLRERIKEKQLSVDTEPSSIIMFEKASEPSTISPNKNQTILFGLLAGLGLSYGFLYLLNMMDQSIKSVEQAEQVLQLPVLAAVPSSEPDGQPTKSRLIMKGSSNSTCSEAFRSLRVNIESMSRTKSNKVVVFTSSMPSEGKTFTSINYAASLAQQGHKTLLIDMDLRKPAVAKEFDLEKSHYVGLTELMISDEKLNQFPDLPMYSPAEGLSILHGGPLIDNPAERLSGYAVEKVVEKAREHYDRIVIDSAPLGPVGDTLTVARLADMVCLVVRCGKTPSKIILRIIDSLHRHGHTPAGIVLNFMKIKSGYGSYYYYYSSDKEPSIKSDKPPYQRKEKPEAASIDATPQIADAGDEASTLKKKRSELESQLNGEASSLEYHIKHPVTAHFQQPEAKETRSLNG